MVVRAASQLVAVNLFALRTRIPPQRVGARLRRCSHRDGAPLLQGGDGDGPDLEEVMNDSDRATPSHRVIVTVVVVVGVWWWWE